MLGMVHCCSAFFFSLQLQSNSCKLHPDEVMEKKILRDSLSRMQLGRSRRRNRFSNSRDCSAWGSPGCPASVMYLTLLFRNMRLMLIVSASSSSIIAPRSLLPPRRDPTPNTLSLLSQPFDPYADFDAIRDMENVDNLDSERGKFNFSRGFMTDVLPFRGKYGFHEGIRKA